ncbi:hypothetical protein V8J88_04205 [Massilia sp. W12]|uniref:hypothetical protein n=1 Tax=Massilia sp. W12 TaxID=3126507 RepID=UPI0030D56FF9
MMFGKIQARAQSVRANYRKWLLAAAALLAAGAAGYTWLTLSWSFSDGDRAGHLQKLSKKGWLCKTWEGELLLNPVPGSAPEKFYFTVPDEGVAQELNRQIGKRITIQYTQHKGVPSSCFGDTPYFARAIRKE